MKFIIPNVEIKTSAMQVIQNAPNQVTVTNGALTVISTGNMPFVISNPSFIRDQMKGVYTLILEYIPIGDAEHNPLRDQFVITEDITFNFTLKEEADQLIVDLNEKFETSLRVDVCTCTVSCYCGSCTDTCCGCFCCPAGSVDITTTETVHDSLGKSLSIDMKKIDALKQATKGFVDIVIPKGIQVGLVSFSGSVISFLPLTTDALSLHNEIDSYTPMTATCISCGIQKATQLLSGIPPDDGKYIILFSDGIPNRPGGEGPAKDAARSAVDAAVAEGIIVHTVAIGDSAALNFMEELAKRGNGLFYKVSCDCPWDCIYEELASKVSNAVVLVNDVSGSMDWRASLDCPGTGIPVVHKNILQDLNISITGTIDCYDDEKFITHKGNLRVEVSPDIISKIILNVKNSKLEYSSLEYPVKHELYRKEIRHGIYEPGYPYTPINPTPSYGNLPAHNTYRVEDSYGYESRIPTATNFEFPYLEQGKEICPSNCFCPSYDITDVTCVDYSEQPPVYYKRSDCICQERDQSYLRPLHSLKTYHNEEFYYYDFVDLYTKEKSELKVIGQSYPKEKTISKTGGSLSGEMKRVFQKGNATEPTTCAEVKPEIWQIPSDAVIIPTDPEDAEADDKQNEPLKVHGLAWRLANCSRNPSSCNINSQFKVGRIIGPIELFGVKYNAGPYVVISSGGSESAESIVNKVISTYSDFNNVNYYKANSDGSALTREIFPLRVCIQDGAYDQPSNLFNEMRIPYKIWSKNCLKESDVIIFGCPAGPTGAQDDEVREFVENCGTYIGTDWNYDYLQHIFPNYFTASKSGSGQAEIWEGSTKGSYDLPQELKEFFQTPYESISGWSLLGGTIVIDSITNPETKVLARGSYSSGQTDKPMAVTFKYGNGRVFYYTIHIEGAATPSQEAFMSSFYSSAGTTTSEEIPSGKGSVGGYILNFTAVQFPELLTKDDFEQSSLTIFIHFRNDTSTQTYNLFPSRRENIGDKTFYVNVTLREPSKIVIESITPGKYNLKQNSNINVNIRLINPLSGEGIPRRKIIVEVEGYGISQEIITDSEGRASFSFKVGDRSTKVRFKFLGDQNFVPTEISDYYDVVYLERVWWFLSPEVLLLIIVLVSIAFFYRWFMKGKISFEEMKKEMKEEETEKEI